MTDARAWLDRASALAREDAPPVYRVADDALIAMNALRAVLDLLDGPRAQVTGHVRTADLRTAITTALEGSAT